MPEENDVGLLVLTAEIVAAHVGHNRVGTAEVSELITQVYGALAGLGQDEAPAPSEELKPAVSIRSSVKPDYIVCLEDGKKLTMLKRYLRSRYGMSPEEYRTKWGLPADYPMVAPNYADRRRTLAKEIGLGRKKA
jgi:predicted transcriptional regulator